MLEAGRELDALVAEKVMGRKVVDGCVEALGRYKNNNQESLPAYSTDIAAAWEVVEKAREKVRYMDMYWDGFRIEFDGKHWAAGFTQSTDADCHASHFGFGNDVPGPSEALTAPLAICLAALKAVGYEPKESA